MGTLPPEEPDYSDTLYVTELEAPNTVNTMPEEDVDAAADHGVVTGDTVSGNRGSRRQGVFDALTEVSRHRHSQRREKASRVLEKEGVEKAWREVPGGELLGGHPGNKLDAAKK